MDSSEGQEKKISSALERLKLRQAEKRATSDTSTDAAPSTSAPATTTSLAPPPEKISKWFITWECRNCKQECVPVRSESRCLCGHRLREHGDISGAGPPRCKAAKCPCVGFFYIFAEGSFILRCRCKHKAVEHAPGDKDHACSKAGCVCKAFESPWVCNCNCPWAQHEQKTVQREVTRFPASVETAVIENINDWSGIKRGDPQ